MNVKFYRDVDGAASGFDMGDIEFAFDNIVFSTRGNPRLKAMIYLSIIELLDGLLRFKGAGRYEFVAVDSSFRILFSRKRNKVLIVHGRDSILVSMEELWQAVRNGVISFSSTKDNRIPEQDSVYMDFKESFDKFMNSTI
ncbi:hypothetical protein [Parachitinimonas caeni]|uniref:Uncharacterized protein n=1 Tax=Parachitinimonas caeni TaxID=3031301 RepID=A0ABT7E4R7_9NEIS|nr:hypothetical protein [Parachitinimonas caeni]MDK2127044.1 hypothetical protein [Parachitinimonas caeni]